jgi:hypothetical protein
MKRRNIIRVGSPNRPITVQQYGPVNRSVTNFTPVNSNTKPKDTSVQVKNTTRQRFQENIVATEHIEGDIIIVNKIGFNLPNIQTKRAVYYVDDLSKVSSTKISFIFIASNNIGDFTYLVGHFSKKLVWGSIIFTPKYKVGNTEIDGVLDMFVKQNFMKTYTSRQKFLDPHKPDKKEEYFAIKYLVDAPEIKRSQRPLKIATVWRTGGTYKAEHVTAIYNACKKYIDEEFEFFCLTDYTGPIHKEVNKIPLIHKWKGYWSKMELFRPGIFSGSDVFYLDLDTLITHDITEIATMETDFFGMRDFNMLNELSSGILKFNADKFNYIYRAFLSNPGEWMKCRGGDQEAIRKILRTVPDFMQDLFPRRMAEFKNHCWDPKLKKVSIPDNYWIVCFHSSPKMDDIQNDPIIKKYWLK